MKTLTSRSAFRHACLAACCAAAVLPLSAAIAPRRQRTFRFDYQTVIHFPAGAKQVRIWIPVAQANPHQSVRVVAIHAAVPYRLTRNARGDRMLYADLRSPRGTTARFDFVYQVRRVLYRAGDYQTL
ncbi:MAG: hypothetical protein ACRD2F_03280, partial [Terriglobales bacterium]